MHAYQYHSETKKGIIISLLNLLTAATPQRVRRAHCSPHSAGCGTFGEAQELLRGQGAAAGPTQQQQPLPLGGARLQSGAQSPAPAGRSAAASLLRRAAAGGAHPGPAACQRPPAGTARPRVPRGPGAGGPERERGPAAGSAPAPLSPPRKGWKESRGAESLRQVGTKLGGTASPRGVSGCWREYLNGCKNVIQGCTVKRVLTPPVHTR